jgi:hypothetical protein
MECSVIRTGQFETSQLKRFIALTCILMALVMAGLEATHAHSDAAGSRNSRPCAICISVHSNAPTVMFHSLPVLHAVDVVAIPALTVGKSTAPELALFIRPPPSA